MVTLAEAGLVAIVVWGLVQVVTVVVLGFVIYRVTKPLFSSKKVD